jgi:ATP-binding cassette subfamily F protein 2
MSGELTPLAGRVSRHAKLKLGKYSQHSADQLDMENTPIGYLMSKFKDEFGEDLQVWRGVVGRYGITGTHQLSKINTLSDGLKSRLVFAEICLSKPDIILLDEPSAYTELPTIVSESLLRVCF